MIKKWNKLTLTIRLYSFFNLTVKAMNNDLDWQYYDNMVDKLEYLLMANM